MNIFQRSENFFLKRITFSVIFFHACCLLFLGFQQTNKPLKKLNKKIAVRTVVVVEPVARVVQVEKRGSLLEEVSPVAEQKPKQKEIKQETRVKKVETVKKLEPVKKVVAKSQDLKNPVVKKEEPIALKETSKQELKQVLEKKEKQQALLKAAKNNLAKANGKAQKSENVLSAPIGPLSFEKKEEGSETAWQMGYRDELAARLQALLKFPEKGEVKIKLTLERSGRVLKLLIASFESKKNKEYIEKTIKSLSFPSFQGDFNELSEYTFSITLKG